MYDTDHSVLLQDYFYSFARNMNRFEKRGSLKAADEARKDLLLMYKIIRRIRRELLDKKIIIQRTRKK